MDYLFLTIIISLLTTFYDFTIGIYKECKIVYPTTLLTAFIHHLMIFFFFTCLFFINNKSVLYGYIIFILLLPVHWYFNKGECIISQTSCKQCFIPKSEDTFTLYLRPLPKNILRKIIGFFVILLQLYLLKTKINNL